MSGYEPGGVTLHKPSRLAEWGYRFESWFPEWFTARRALGFIVWVGFLLLIIPWL